MLKAMISQPLAGKSGQEIAVTRECAKRVLERHGYDLADTLIADEFYSMNNMVRRGVVHIPLCFLGKSLKCMSLCHAVYFCAGWENSRECRIEHEAAKAYGLTILYEGSGMFEG